MANKSNRLDKSKSKAQLVIFLYARKLLEIFLASKMSSSLADYLPVHEQLDIKGLEYLS